MSGRDVPAQEATARQALILMLRRELIDTDILDSYAVFHYESRHS